MIKEDGLPWMVGGSFSGEKAMIGGLSGCVRCPFSLGSSHRCFPGAFTSSGCSLDTTRNCGNRGILASVLLSEVGNLVETSCEVEFEVGLGDLDRVITSLSSVWSSIGDVGMLLGDVDNRCSGTILELG